MTISDKTIQRLIEIITGNTDKSPYRSGLQLIEFFRDFGERDLYGQGFPGAGRLRAGEAEEVKFNGTETMKQIIAAGFDFRRRIQSRGTGGDVQSPPDPGWLSTRTRIPRRLDGG